MKEKLQDAEISPDEISAVLLTHEHIDHVRSLGALVRQEGNVAVYATRGTIDALIERNPDLSRALFVPVTGGKAFDVGDIRVMPFNVSHDTAEPVAYAFEKNGHRAAVVTDTGFVSDEIFENIKDADLLVLEANHERNILLYGRYPYNLKNRILSDLGHLSNASCGRALCELYSAGVRRAILGHLSRDNNFESLALETVRSELLNQDIPESEFALAVAHRDRMTGRFDV